jgi:hypothetical protein
VVSWFRICGFRFTGTTVSPHRNIQADAILDRIVHDAYKINIESTDPSKDISMREVYVLDQSLSE